MATDFDAVIIGSGFGGAVAALRLTEGGYRVLVLERGRRWKREEYPSVSKKDYLWIEGDPVNSNGFLDFRFLGNIGTVAGAGVGGGSLHFSNVVIDAQPDLFDSGWPPEITFAEMTRYYQKVSAVLRPSRLPSNQFSNRTKLLKKAADLAGFGAQFDLLDLNVKFNQNYAYDAANEPRPQDSVMTPNDDNLEQGFCVHTGQCNLGCPVEARNTLALNYIPRAEKHGAEVRPLHIVRNIEPLADGSYRIHFERIEQGQLKPGSVTARIVVVAAGSIGSTELLLRCQKEHKSLKKFGRTLGSRWCTNANYLTLAFHTGQPVYPGRGPTISGGIRFFGNNAFKGSRFMIEDGGVPDLLAQSKEALKNPTGDALKFSNAIGSLSEGLELHPFDDLMPWFAQGRDEPIGKFRVERWFFGLIGDYVLRLSWDTNGARKVLDAIQEVHRMLAEKTGGKFLIQTPDATVTPHPLGGCPMASRSEDGVVNHLGETFAYRNLYVADGAILPRPVGHNPSKTIAALSERIAEGIVRESR